MDFYNEASADTIMANDDRLGTANIKKTVTLKPACSSETHAQDEVSIYNEDLTVDRRVYINYIGEADELQRIGKIPVDSSVDFGCYKYVKAPGVKILGTQAGDNVLSTGPAAGVVERSTKSQVISIEIELSDVTRRTYIMRLNSDAGTFEIYVYRGKLYFGNTEIGRIETGKHIISVLLADNHFMVDGAIDSTRIYTELYLTTKDRLIYGNIIRRVRTVDIVQNDGKMAVFNFTCNLCGWEDAVRNSYEISTRDYLPYAYERYAEELAVVSGVEKLFKGWC